MGYKIQLFNYDIRFKFRKERVKFLIKVITNNQLWSNRFLETGLCHQNEKNTIFVVFGKYFAFTVWNQRSITWYQTFLNKFLSLQEFGWFIQIYFYNFTNPLLYEQQ